MEGGIEKEWRQRGGPLPSLPPLYVQVPHWNSTQNIFGSTAVAVILVGELLIDVDDHRRIIIQACPTK